MDFRKYVERGASLLDKEMPGWEERIDLSTLELDDPCKCVVGQLYGDFDEVIDGLIGNERPHEYGFDIHFFAMGKVWEALTEEWRILIQARRNVRELEKNLALEPAKEGEIYV